MIKDIAIIIILLSIMCIFIIRKLLSIRIDIKLKNKNKNKRLNIGKNNNVFLQKEDGNLEKLLYLKDCEIIVQGENNNIYIGENTKFNKSQIRLYGDNIILKIGKNCLFHQLQAYYFSMRNRKNEFRIGDNFQNVRNLEIYAGGGGEN